MLQKHCNKSNSRGYSGGCGSVGQAGQLLVVELVINDTEQSAESLNVAFSRLRVTMLSFADGPAPP